MKIRLSNIFSHLGTIISTSFLLFLFGLMMTALFVANSLSRHVQENMNVSVVLRQDLTEDEAKKLSAQLLAMPEVKSLLYISREQAIEDLTKELNLRKTPMETLGYNPLFPLMEINMHAAFANIHDIERFAQALKTQQDVIDVQYQPTVVAAVNKNIASIMLALFLLCAVFIFVVVVLISNTVRLSIYSHRFLFYTMKLVGADKSY
ncbi:MAG: permease-like cell division protein FtsX, partial [Prevotellaceae bacterium]|nr:permease-like cell division protein FtsX [Prevotellaceae bacterium]